MKLNEIYNIDCRIGLKQLLLENSNEKFVIVTDPPFNIGYKYSSYHDKMNEQDYYNMLADVFGNLPFACIHYPEQLYKLAARLNKIPTKIMSWVYNSNCAKQHRDIAYFGITPNMALYRQPYKNPNDKRIKERIARGELGAKSYDWLNCNIVKNVTKKNKGIKHPCQMPLDVMKWIVGVIPADYVIIDPFSGTGTTAAACILLGRRFVGFEIDKEYYEQSKQRINNINN